MSSEMVSLTKEQCLNVKHVLFGNQKQANITNEAVVKLVARGILNAKPDCTLGTESEVSLAIQGILEGWVQQNYKAEDPMDEVFIMLVAGEVSLANLKEDAPKYVNVYQPNPESPKYNFRVCKLGEEDPEIDMSATLGDGVSSASTGGTSGIDVENNRQDIVAYTEELKNRIISVAPESVKAEFGNDYAAALYLYPSYAKNM